METSKKLLAEFFGTFWLVFGGCGSAIFAAKFIADADGNVIQVGIGFAGVALAFGLTVLTMVYAVGHISGGHFNPAVTVGAVLAGRTPAKDLPGYWGAQVVGGLLAGALLWLIASGRPGFEATGNMAANGFGEHSPGGYSMMAVLVAEVVLTFFFLQVILGSTHGRAPAGFAPLAIGLALTLIHLISIPVTNTSVNPARSTGPAVFVGGWALGQLWLFWVAPIIGAVISGFVYRWLGDDVKTPVVGERRPARA